MHVNIDLKLQSLYKLYIAFESIRCAWWTKSRRSRFHSAKRHAFKNHQTQENI